MDSSAWVERGTFHGCFHHVMPANVVQASGNTKDRRSVARVLRMDSSAVVDTGLVQAVLGYGQSIPIEVDKQDPI